MMGMENSTPAEIQALSAELPREVGESALLAQWVDDAFGPSLAELDGLAARVLAGRGRVSSGPPNFTWCQVEHATGIRPDALLGQWPVDYTATKLAHWRVYLAAQADWIDWFLGEHLWANKQWRAVA